MPKQSADRVYVCIRRLISAPGPPTAALPGAMADKGLTPPGPAGPLEPARCLFEPHPIGRRMSLERRVLRRESVLRVGSCSCACFLRGLHAPRHATKSLPCPVDASRPQLSKNAGRNARASWITTFRDFPGQSPFTAGRRRAVILRPEPGQGSVSSIRAVPSARSSGA